VYPLSKDLSILIVSTANSFLLQKEIMAILNPDCLTRFATAQRSQMVTESVYEKSNHNHKQEKYDWLVYNNPEVKKLDRVFRGLLVQNPTQGLLDKLLEIGKDEKFLKVLEGLWHDQYALGYNSYYESDGDIKVFHPVILKQWQTSLHREIINLTMEDGYCSGQLDH
jgi:hypothetical protein